MSPSRGILAVDETHVTIASRFEPLGIASTAKPGALAGKCFSRIPSPRPLQQHGRDGRYSVALE